MNQITVEISDLDAKGLPEFRREIIDDVFKGIKQSVSYKGKKYMVVDGRYGSSNGYPRGFTVTLEERVMSGNDPWYILCPTQLTLWDRIRLLFGYKLYTRFDSPDGQCHAACDISWGNF